MDGFCDWRSHARLSKQVRSYGYLDLQRRVAIFEEEKVIRLVRSLGLIAALLPFKFCSEVSATVRAWGMVNVLLCLHIGHKPLDESCWIHVRRQCWKSSVWVERCYHVVVAYHVEGMAACSYHYDPSLAVARLQSGGSNLQRAQSSPGYLHVGHVPSNCIRHMPQTSSSGMSHRHDATAFHSLMVTFILALGSCRTSFLPRVKVSTTKV